MIVCDACRGDVPVGTYPMRIVARFERHLAHTAQTTEWSLDHDAAIGREVTLCPECLGSIDARVRRAGVDFCLLADDEVRMPGVRPPVFFDEVADEYEDEEDVDAC